MNTSDTFSAWQHRALGWLLGWGAGSIVVGAALAKQRAPRLQQIGWQALAWGAIDAALAWAGRRGARRRLQALSAQNERREASRFQRIVAINAGLDVLYILGGWRLARDRRADRQGMGLGIAIQGAFLLLFDSLLTWRSARWRNEQPC